MEGGVMTMENATSIGTNVHAESGRQSLRYRLSTLRQYLGTSAVLGILLTGTMVIAALFAPLIVSHDPNQNHLQDALQPPSSAYWFGTDHLGRDLFARVVYGAQKSLFIALMVQVIAVTTGTLFGLLAGYLGGKADKLIMGLANIMFSFPGILFAIAIMAALGPGIFNLFIALGVVSWPEICRLVRAETISLKQREFVEAGYAMGAGTWRILFRYILPNCYGNIIVLATLGMASAILAESSLSFLGLGVQPPDPSWGSLVGQGKDYMYQAPWFMFIPGIVMFITILGINLLGDTLRDWFDPKMKSNR